MTTEHLSAANRYAFTDHHIDPKDDIRYMDHPLSTTCRAVIHQDAPELRGSRFVYQHLLTMQ